jgi:hypothetical protein
MALSSQDRIDLARTLAQKLFVSTLALADKNHTDLVNAVIGFDNALDATLNQGVAVFGGTTTIINGLAAPGLLLMAQSQTQQPPRLRQLEAALAAAATTQRDRLVALGLFGLVGPLLPQSTRLETARC